MQLWADQEISEKRVQGYGMSNSSNFPRICLLQEKEHFNHLKLYEMLTREIQYKTNVSGLNDAKFQVKTRHQSMLWRYAQCWRRLKYATVYSFEQLIKNNSVWAKQSTTVDKNFVFRCRRVTKITLQIVEFGFAEKRKRKNIFFAGNRK